MSARIVREAKPTTDDRPARKRYGKVKWIVLAGAALAIAGAAGVGGGGSDAPAAAPTTTPVVSAPIAAPSETISTMHTVTYQVTGTGAAADVTSTGASLATTQDQGAPLPYTRDVQLDRFMPFSVLAQNKSAEGSITCTVLVDGVQVTTNTSTGAYAVVTCNGTV